jgi:hypothetical protein
VKLAEVAVVTTLEVPLATRFGVLCCLHRTWWESHGEKKWPWMQVNHALFISSHLGLVGAAQGVKTIGTLLQMTSECSFVQGGHSLASAAPLK